jgi:hypothetical protein
MKYSIVNDAGYITFAQVPDSSVLTLIPGHRFVIDPIDSLDYNTETQYPRRIEPVLPHQTEVQYEIIDHDLVYLANVYRQQRNMLIQQSDVKMLKDVYDRLSDQQKTDWEVYREALRNLPEQPGFPRTVEWPIAPSEFNIEIVSADEN